MHGLPNLKITNSSTVVGHGAISIDNKLKTGKIGKKI